ncbi:MAG: glycosyltransferase family 9 protein [Winogradskyella sp.]|uniref:glycosyltransferase family 9 protein n=1 Tax=Winogradskyella sp. TaxID=1883156 RepID=UPI0017CD8C57|nr:glycosyltransferase family 9 protein [Winogradskyella sp.]
MKVLIIQQKMIGDVLTSSILFEAIKYKYPDATLHYVINSHTYPVVEHNPFIDQFHFFTQEHEKSKRELWQFAKAIRKEHFDVVIDVYSKYSSNLISLLSGAKTKISKYKWYTSFIYSHTYEDKTTSQTNAGLAIENRLQLLYPLNIDNSKIIRPKIYLTDKEKVLAKKVLETNHIDLKKPVYMIGVLGSGQAKTYPFDYMAKIIDTIVSNEPKSQILFNYIPNQKGDAKAIYNLCTPQTQKQIYFEIFGSSLREFLALTSHCEALIGNEGGATNMAKALGIPTFTIFAPWIMKEAWNMFDNDQTHISVHLNDYDANLYQDVEDPKALKSRSTAYYEKFRPSFFKDKLVQFVNGLD